jgi:hypothetical protein
MQLVVGQDQAVAGWVASRIPQMDGTPGFGLCAAIGVAHHGVLLGGVVYHDYQPKFASIQLSFASADTRWLIGPPGDRCKLIRDLMEYPFGQLKVGRVWSLTPKRNRPARRFLDKFGFKREGVARQGFGTDDAIISAMLAREWRSSRFARPVEGIA